MGDIVAKIDMKKANEMSGDYQEHLIKALKNKKAALAYLQVSLDEYNEDHDREIFMLALKNVAIAQGGLGHLASETHLNREHLYRLFSGKGNPTFDTLTTILDALGMRIKLAAA